MPDPETGEPINVSHLIPRSREDLERRHGCLRADRRVTRRAHGPHARLHERHLRRLRRPRRRMGRSTATRRGAGQPGRLPEAPAPRRHLADPHHRPSDHRQGDGRRAGGRQRRRAPQGGRHRARHRGARRARSWRPWRRSPTSSRSIRPRRCRRAPTPTRCRSASRWPRRASSSSAATAVGAGNRFDHPLSSRFDEQDAFVIFDDVEVPRDRLFIDANLAVYNTVMATSWPPNIMQQTMIRAQTKLEFAWGLAPRMAEAINGVEPETEADARRDLELRGADPRGGRDGRGRGPRVGRRRVVSRRRRRCTRCAACCRCGSRA